MIIRIENLQKLALRISLLILGIFLSQGLASAQAETAIYRGDTVDLSSLKISTLYKGDAKSFVAKNLDVEGVYKLAQKESSVWHIESKFLIGMQPKDTEELWLQLRTNTTAAEIFLNDKLLLTNGIVGTSPKTELGGKNLVRIRIPRDLIRSDLNTLKVRFSNFKYNKGVVFSDLSIGSLYEFQKRSSIMSTAPLVFSGIFIFAVFINIALYFSLEKSFEFILLANLFLCNFFVVAYEMLYWNGFTPTDSFFQNLSLRYWLEIITFIFLTFVILFEFGYNKFSSFISILAFPAVYIVSSLLDFSEAIAFSLVPLSLSIIALIRRLTNSPIITASLFLISALNFIDDYNFLDNVGFVHSNFIVTSFFYKTDNLAMVLFALVMTFTSAKSILSKTNALNETQLKLERLEYQFLQKHIQPHFLMNSLMSLQQLVLKDQKNAELMIEALSEEFHLLTVMGKKKLVPISQEIEMCNTHLKIMSIQQKATFSMKTIGIDGTEMIPPAVIHTLVENGVTHGYSGNVDAHFELSKERTPEGIRYRLFNDSKTGPSSQKPASGTGLKYVEARLEESFPSRWTLNSRRVSNGWEATIEIKGHAV